MSAPVVISWLPSQGNEAAIASVQSTTTAEQALVLNSTVSALPQGPYIYDKVIRTINITRNNVPGSATATITGYGAPIKDTVSSPADVNPQAAIALVTESLITGQNSTVESTYIYSQILSITIDNPIDEMTFSVGFGNDGITDYVFIDYNRAFNQVTAQLQFVVRSTIDANIFTSLTKPQTPNSNGSLDNFSSYPIPAFPLSSTSLTADTLITNPYSPASIIWAAFSNSETLGTTDEVYFTVLQQGIR